MEHPKFTVGEYVKDLTFDPPIAGIIMHVYENKPDTYDVRLETTAIFAKVHARNLERIAP